jgi:hypothetical protein
MSIVLAVLLYTLAPSSPARANECGHPDGCIEQIFPMSALAFIVGDAVFAVSEIVWAARDAPPPLELTVSEAIFGAITVAYGAAMYGVAQDRPGHEANSALFGGAAIAFVVGVSFLWRSISVLAQPRARSAALVF